MSVRPIHAALIYTLWLLPIWHHAAQAQSGGVLTADTQTLTVGDPVKVTLFVFHEPDAQAVVEPVAWEPVELLERLPTESEPNGTRFQWTVTLWQTGEYLLPPISFEVINEQGESTTAVSNPLALEVVSVLPADDKTLRDIRPQATLPFPSFGWIWLLVAAGGAVAFWLRHRSQPKSAFTSSPTPHAVALLALTRLEQTEAERPSTLHELATAVFNIVRQFIRQTYQLPTDHQTTDELRQALPQAPHLTHLLNELDHIRFMPQQRADAYPLVDIARQALQTHREETPS